MLWPPALHFYGLTFRVNQPELGVVTRFGKVARQEPPELQFRMPSISPRL